MESGLEVRLLDVSSIHQQVEVYMIAFEIEEPIDKEIDHWKKKHFENPVHSSYIFGAFDKEKLVSINAYMPMKYCFNGRKCKVIQSCESGTLPEYRGKGIWSKVVSFAVEYFTKEQVYDFFIGFPNFKNSYGGFIKMSWSHDADVINYVMIGNGKSFVKSLTNGRTLPFSGIGNVQRIKIPLNARKDLRICDEVSKENASLKGFSLCDDTDFIEWKKSYKELREFGIKDCRGNIVAVCRYYLKEYNGNKVVHLCNLKVLEQECSLESLYALSVKEILKRHQEIAFIRAWAMKGSNTEKAYKRLFFLKSNHRNPFVTYQLKENTISGECLHDAYNWNNISFIDLD